MLYVISSLLAFFSIIFYTIFSETKNFRFFFIFFKINFILFYYRIFSFYYFFFIFYMLIKFYIELDIVFFFQNIFNIGFNIVSFFQDIFSIPVTHCAGVPKLVELASDTKTKTIFKYNFSLLEKNKNFFSDRTNILELNKICSELNIIHNCNLIKMRNLLYIINTNQIDDIEKLNKIIINFHNQNLFEKQNLKLVNNKIGIPLYNDLFIKTFEFQSILNLKNFNTDIRLNIYKFLPPEILYKNINYFEIKMFVDKTDNLIIYKQTHTIDAVDKENSIVTKRKTIDSKIVNKYRVSSTVLDNSGKIITVIDQQIVSETPHGREKPKILKGGIGLIESYIYYYECMDKTVKLLNSSNNKLSDLKFLLSSKPTTVDERISVIGSISSNLDFYNFYKPRIIEKMLVPNPQKLFFEDGIILNKIILDKFVKIDEIFLEQLKKDSTILRDIHTQQSGMSIDYTKLIKKMESSDENMKNYFDQNLKNKIYRASNGDFSLKRSRP